MKKISFVFCVVLAGCGASVPAVQEQPQVVSVGSDALPTTDGWFALPGSSDSMRVLKWTATITNESNVAADRLIIDCVDKDGQVRAEADFVCRLAPGQTMKKTVEIDVPADELSRIVQVRFTLVNDD